MGNGKLDVVQTIQHIFVSKRRRKLLRVFSKQRRENMNVRRFFVEPELPSLRNIKRIYRLGKLASMGEICREGFVGSGLDV